MSTKNVSRTTIDMLFSMMTTLYQFLINSNYSWGKIKLMLLALLTKESSVDHFVGINTMLHLSNGKLDIIIQNSVADHVPVSLKKERIYGLSANRIILNESTETYVLVVHESLERNVGNIESSKENGFEGLQVGRCSFYRSESY